jgi:hypothetical protein
MRGTIWLGGEVGLTEGPPEIFRPGHRLYLNNYAAEIIGPVAWVMGDRVVTRTPTVVLNHGIHVAAGRLTVQFDSPPAV